MKNPIKNTLILILLVLFTIVTVGGILYLLDKYEIINLPENNLFTFISQDKKTDDGDINDQEKEEIEQETLFTGEITSWPTEIPARFPAFNYGTLKTATGLGENERYKSAWIVEITSVTLDNISNYTQLLQTEDWEVKEAIESGIWTVTMASKGELEISLMWKKADGNMNLELISY